MKYPVTYSAPLRLEWINDTQKWRVLWPFNADWKSHTVRVPEGYMTDLASVPRIFRSLVPKSGHQAAVTHDWSYGDGAPHMSRSDIDSMFLAGLLTLGVPWLRAKVMYWAVRAAGWAFFK